MTRSSDHVIRAMTDDGAFRVLVARTTDTVRRIAEVQDLAGVSAACLGEVVTAAVLVRETMAPANRVQVLFTDKIGTRLVGDAHPEGNTRGLAQITDEVLGVLPGEGGILQVVRIVRSGQPHQGYVETTDEGGVAGALQQYFAQSEQIETMLGLACVVDDEGGVRHAGGIIVQLLPEVTEPPLARLRARLDELGDFRTRLVRHRADPAVLLAELLDGFEHTMLADSAVQFRCTCGPDRAVGAASTLGREELQQLLETGEELAITCDFCRTRYTVGAADYRRILDRS
jgi:molecular chaperone Hsp33